MNTELKLFQRWPNFLDNTVAGGISAGATPLESILRECAEEASFDADFVREAVKSTGIVSYGYRTEGGWIQPEVEYVYDLELPAPTLLEGSTIHTLDQSLDPKSLPTSTYTADSIIPRPNPLDNEVASFHLISLTKCIELALAGHFKPNCALVLVDFAIRHGEISFENDNRYVEICRRMKGDIGGLPGPI
jgi:8-oxo-dGTP pyrophosphatase MutT (NUDIX family)